MWSRYLKLCQGTKAELALESALCKVGLPYRFQFPVWRYILDFVLPTFKVVIEVDGPSHDKPAQKAKDAARTEWLESKGWTVVRCKNEDAISDPEGTVRKLLKDAKVKVP